jgi:pyruvate/2-oxoglutarate dehydrogenase complex dihydrolipoamide acyltransferase (E2) component
MSDKAPIYKPGSIVTHSGGTYAKVLQVKYGVHICTDWFDTMAAAKKADEVGLVRFNESARSQLGIKLASQGGKTGDEPKPSDAVVALAKENNVDLSTVKGTGANGNILIDDVKAVIKERDSK